MKKINLEPMDRKHLTFLLLPLFLAVCPALGQGTWRTKPFDGPRYETLAASRQLPLQKVMEDLFPDANGRFVTGPLDPLFDGDIKARDIYHTVRLVCPDYESLNDALDVIWKDSAYAVLDIERCLTSDCEGRPQGYRGAFVRFIKDDVEYLVQFVSVQQIRWMFWAESWLGDTDPTVSREKLGHYGRSISDHLFAVDRKWDFIPEPISQVFGLSAQYDFYKEPPPTVFPNEEEYRTVLESNAGIHNDIARGILSFKPTDSLLTALIADAPREAYPNKQSPALQFEYRDFFINDGDVRVMHTLTRDAFDSLETGEYHFAVNLSGKVRFYRGDTTKEEDPGVDEKAWPNEAFLFPGEAVLTAGIFSVERDSVAHITAVNTRSEHYFYSNLSPTARDDIAVKSNQYILSLGHFFKALKEIEIPLNDIIISKF